jgi:hypothetical protein
VSAVVWTVLPAETPAARAAREAPPDTASADTASADRARAGRPAPERVGHDAALHWTRLGDAVVLFADVHEPVRRAAGPGAAVRDAGGLNLVIQVGRAFQVAHPEVPVLLDRGRHLVVDAAAIGPEEGLDWAVRPLPRDVAVVDRPTPSARRADPALDELLSVLSQPSYEETLRAVTAPPTRHSLDPGFVIAAETAAAALGSVGYDVTREPITVGAGHCENVVADLAGTAEAPRGLVVASAHLDSVNHADGPGAPAPGADDNASGAAGLLELARALATRRWRHDLRLILFGGEEQGLFGSKQHVAALDGADRARVRAVVNMDMIARLNTPAPGVLLEGAELSRTLVDELAAAAATWTALAVSTSLHPYASDHVPFIDAGIPAVLTIEGNDTTNGDVHTARDTLATLHPPLALEILRMNLAVLAGYLEAVEGDPPGAPA